MKKDISKVSQVLYYIKENQTQESTLENSMIKMAHRACDYAQTNTVGELGKEIYEKSKHVPSNSRMTQTRKNRVIRNNVEGMFSVQKQSSCRFPAYFGVLQSRHQLRRCSQRFRAHELIWKVQVGAGRSPPETIVGDPVQGARVVFLYKVL